MKALPKACVIAFFGIALSGCSATVPLLPLLVVESEEATPASVSESEHSAPAVEVEDDIGS